MPRHTGQDESLVAKMKTHRLVHAATGEWRRAADVFDPHNEILAAVFEVLARCGPNPVQMWIESVADVDRVPT